MKVYDPVDWVLATRASQCLVSGVRSVHCWWVGAFAFFFFGASCCGCSSVGLAEMVLLVDCSSSSAAADAVAKLLVFRFLGAMSFSCGNDVVVVAAVVGVGLSEAKSFDFGDGIFLVATDFFFLGVASDPFNEEEEEVTDFVAVSSLALDGSSTASPLFLLLPPAATAVSVRLDRLGILG